MFRPRKVIVAPASTLVVLERLRPYLTTWPAVLPARTDPTVRPLAMGTGTALVAWLKPETDAAGAAPGLGKVHERMWPTIQGKAA